VSTPAFEAAFTFLDSCDQLHELDAIEEAFAAAVLQFGFDRFIITALPRPSASLDPLVRINAWPTEWYDRYSLNHYFNHDPVGQFALLHNQPFRWADVPAGLNGNRRSRTMMGEAREFGLVDGYCVPLTAPCGRRAVVSLAARSALELSSRERAAVHVVAITAFGRVAAQRGETAAERLLSLREQDVMSWTAAGKSAWEVSRILGISERTVKAHLENVRRRLDAVNTTQAVVICIRLGQIQPF
jgi:LuxR family transcriptional regulator, quorum-sensing system regulator BjaR1